MSRISFSWHDGLLRIDAYRGNGPIQSGFGIHLMPHEAEALRAVIETGPAAWTWPVEFERPETLSAPAAEATRDPDRPPPE